MRRYWHFSHRAIDVMDDKTRWHLFSLSQLLLTLFQIFLANFITQLKSFRRNDDMNNLCFTKMRLCNLWSLSQGGWISLLLKMMNKIKSFLSLVPLWPHLHCTVFLDWRLCRVRCQTNSFTCFVLFLCFSLAAGLWSVVHMGALSMCRFQKKIWDFEQKHRLQEVTFKVAALFHSSSLFWLRQWTTAAFTNKAGVSFTCFFFAGFFKSVSAHAHLTWVVHNRPP